MKERFVACPDCSRHVKEGDEACPFCGAAAVELPPPAPTLAERVSRAAMLAAGAGGVLVMTGCGSSNPTVQVFYGVACTGDACAGFATDAGAGDSEASTPEAGAPDAVGTGD
jgi:hypothetical protein